MGILIPTSIDVLTLGGRSCYILSFCQKWFECIHKTSLNYLSSLKTQPATDKSLNHEITDIDTLTLN